MHKRNLPLIWSPPVRYAAAFAIAVASALPQPAPAQTASEVMLVNAKTGKCLTIAGGVSTDNNVESVQFDCDTDPSRRWTLKGVTGNNVFQIRNVKTGKCLTIAGGVSTDNNVTALQFNCDTHPSRTWRISDVTAVASTRSGTSRPTSV